jgi:replicative DNA helicase
LTKLRSSADKHNQIHTFGHKGSDYLYKEALYGKGIPLIPTGYAGWDTHNGNGGVNSTGVFTLGGPTGGGKTAMALQLMQNMTRRGFSVCLVSLEMTEIEVMYRLLSNVGEVPVTKFLGKKLTKGEKFRVKKSYKRYRNKLKKLGTRFSVWAPDEDVTMEDILFSLKPYGYSVIIVDYISLLGTDGSVDEWKALRDASRIAKRYANTNKTLIVLLAQLGADGNLRYAKGIAENSDVMWVWNYTEENRETGLIEIRPVKARNFNPSPFTLLHNYTYMMIGDADDRAIKRLRDQDDGRGEARREKLNKFERDLSVEIDEDD